MYIVFIYIFLSICWIFFEKKGSAPIALQVHVVKPKELDVPIYLHTLGTIIPAATVQIKSQVNGKTIKIPYQDGSYVHEGNILSLIDDEPYIAFQFKDETHKNKLT